MALQFEKIKLPGEVLDYSITWRKRLKTDTIVTSEWALLNATECGLVIDREEVNALETTMWLTGGIPGKKGNFVNTITTGAGRTLQYACSVLIRSE